MVLKGDSKAYKVKIENKLGVRMFNKIAPYKLVFITVFLIILSSCRSNTSLPEPTGANSGPNNTNIPIGNDNGDKYNYNGTIDFTTITNIGVDATTDFLQAIARQSDGKIVAAGYSYTNYGHSDFVVVRYNANGSLDTTFGPDLNGKVTTDIGIDTRDEAYAVAIQPIDQKILVAGYSYQGDPNFAVVRYNTDGSLDLAFGPDLNGKVTTDISRTGSYDRAYAIAIQSDGKIVVVGDSFYEFAAARYNIDGTLDENFGKGGTLTTAFMQGTHHRDAFAKAVAIETVGSEEKIVAVGNTYFDGNATDFAMVRYNADGTLDNSFAPDYSGIVNTTIDANSEDYATAVAIQTISGEDKIVVAGYSAAPLSEEEYNFALVRYNASGSLDTSFGLEGTGKTTTEFVRNAQDYATSLAIQSDGKIVIGGSTYSPGWFTAQDFALARYGSNGVLDKDFGIDGRMTIDVNRSVDTLSSLIIQPEDGKIVLGGRTNANGGYDFVLMRIN